MGEWVSGKVGDWVSGLVGEWVSILILHALRCRQANITSMVDTNMNKQGRTASHKKNGHGAGTVTVFDFACAVLF